MEAKILPGSQHQRALDVRVLSALSHRLGHRLATHAVRDKTNEISCAVPLLSGLVLEGRISTMDALLTQRTIAQVPVAGGGDDVMLVKGNQSRVENDIALVVSEPPPTIIS